MRIYLGIDPGVTGALAWLGEDDSLVIDDMPFVEVKVGKKNRKLIDIWNLSALLQRRIDQASDFHSNVFAAIEKVTARPGQGVTSTFGFGRSLGVLEGVCAAYGLPLDYVAPTQWQRQVSMAKGPTDHASRLRIRQLFPQHADYFQRIKDHDRADAALIAYWRRSKDV